MLPQVAYDQQICISLNLFVDIEIQIFIVMDIYTNRKI